MDIEHIRLQFNRLIRHHQFCKDNPDPIGLLDLTHTLRVWGEMANDIDALIKSKGLTITFPFHEKKSKEMKRLLNQFDYSYFPLISAIETSGIQISKLTFIKGVLSHEEVKKLYEAGPPPNTIQKNITFTDWLGAIMFEKKQDAQTISISRGILIKRVANILGASHPKDKDEEGAKEKFFDKYILELTNIEVVNGYPLAYYQLLEIADGIINTLKPLFI